MVIKVNRNEIEKYVKVPEYLKKTISEWWDWYIITTEREDGVKLVDENDKPFDVLIPEYGKEIIFLPKTPEKISLVCDSIKVPVFLNINKLVKMIFLQNAKIRIENAPDYPYDYITLREKIAYETLSADKEEVYYHESETLHTIGIADGDVRKIEWNLGNTSGYSISALFRVSIPCVVSKSVSVRGKEDENEIIIFYPKKEE